MHAIPTRYGNATFRSRLEARWAVVFDGLSLQWEYEEEGYRLPDNLSYLPDFWLPQARFYAEVKPNDDRSKLILTDEAYMKARGLVYESRRPLLFLDGLPRLTNYWAMLPQEASDDRAPDPSDFVWEDVDLFHWRCYHRSERRFFMSTGTSGEREHVNLAMHAGPGSYDDAEAIIAYANGFQWNQR
jgi:hypothetical protein